MSGRPNREGDSGKKNNTTHRDGSEFDKLLDNYSSWWTVVGNTPEHVLTSPRKKAPVSRVQAASGLSKERIQGSSIHHNPTTRNILSKHLSAPVISVEPIEIMPKPLFPTGAGLDLASVPVTPKKQKPLQGPPSTGRTRAIRNAFEGLDIKYRSPSKEEKEKIPQLQFQHPGPLPRNTVVVEVEDDEDEDEVNGMLLEPESAPSTQPSSLFEYETSQQSMVTPASSWSVDERGGQGSWSSVGAGVPTGHKRPRPSDSSEIEVKVKSHTVDDVFTTPKVRKERRGDSPSKSSQSFRPISVRPITVPVSTDAPPAISSFFRGTLGVDLHPIMISHSSDTQRLMDELDLAWGVQYEFARGVSLGQWSWAEVSKVLREKSNVFRGPNAETAFKVGALMRNREIRNVNVTLWQELDREQEAILENKGRGLGLMGKWGGQEDWFGGRIQQIARLSKDPSGQYRVQLEPMEKRRSHRFARYCGSRRILQLRIPKDLILKESLQLKTFLQGKFILCGRIFVPFHAKDHSLYMVETNENWERRSQEACGDQYRISFDAFINWHNPPEYNHKQAVSKYVTRYALGLSTSIPVLEFQEQNMYLVDDIYGSEYKGYGASAEETMTDGCGFINQAALVAINAHINKSSLPIAVQGRIAGAKGLWILHPDDNSPEYKIWVRDSQNKIKHPELGRSHRIFELVAASQPSTPISASRQSIVNLSFNGVPDQILMRYLEEGLTEEIEPLVNWNRPKAAPHLWTAINTTGGVARARLARCTAGISRALGLTKRVWAEVEGEAVDDGDIFDESNSSYTGRNEYSKAPLSLHEFAIELVQAGFHPSQSKLLREKLEYIIDQTIKTCIEKYRIPLPESLDGFVVPDPLGVLEEGEIYYRSSQSLRNPRTQMTCDILTGDVILGRYPIRIASDLQKVKAVNIPELYQWPDVVITSTKGARSLPSLLSGGDMDGDELFILREPEIVQPFTNNVFVPPPTDLLEANFERDIKLVGPFCEHIKNQPPAKQQAALQEALLLNLNEDRKGLYSVFHDNAIEKYGYSHPKAIRLAYMFNTLLDASKSGLILKEGIFEKDREEFGGGAYGIEDTAAYILNKLQDAGQAVGEKLKKDFNDAAKSCTNRPDPDLIAPYEDATEFANGVYAKTKWTGFAEDLTKIRNHVEVSHEKWAQACSKSKSKSASKKKSASGGEDLSREAARLFALPVEGIIATRNVDEIKASYAYVSAKDSPFAFQVAFRQLCEIKGRAASGGLAPCIREIDEMKTIPASHIKAVEKSYND
ncbi:hypothetical protein P691DRAFT_731304 [Macrolepiota fuliginosa MF-IS2]|uniref:RNA-dependent RNA polymerase n=1 Tax=Macrolepiota fuliginosa MF-IS2 TaxID=1400762 RepID=A0A9P5XA59_9AGAR|nr:hypothetical protein P691DRAFT_731304 [Macrolepiota fuliginosa MF-IS2]